MSRDVGRHSREAQPNVSDRVVAENQDDAQSGSALEIHRFSNPAGELDDPDMAQLRAYLEAGRLPSIFLARHVGQMQQLYNRSMHSGTTSKAQQLLQGMHATDESKQLQSVTEMCQLLVMGNEDTLSGFPSKAVVPALITLLKMEHNFDMMNHACRALTYMMEALPRTSAVVVDAAPTFLEKLQSIQCMDVAEQSLTALEMLSRRHAASILKANGLSSCLLYVDFFSLPAQRNALTVAANCCSILSPSEQHSDFDKYCGNSIALLIQRLSHHDKKCVESVCLCFARLVDNFHSHPDVLQKIASGDLLQNLQTLLVLTPPLIGSNTFVMVIRTMTLLCSSCPNLATELVRNNIAETLRYLLCGNVTEEEHIELVSRRPQELYEITSLIGELMPRLPSDDPIFSVNNLLKKTAKGKSDQNSSVWQWRDGDSSWHSYSNHDNRIIEEAQRSGDHEASLLIQGRVYMLDFTIMQQINEDSGHMRDIRRKTEQKEQDTAGTSNTETDNPMTDARVSLVKDDCLVISHFVRLLFTLLYEVYGSSVGSPTVRHKCLRAVQRMIYHAEPDLLRDVLKNLSVSSHIASMMSSNDLKVVVGALQMAMILMNKLPDIFQVYFRRQGVTHQIKLFLDQNHKVVGSAACGSPSGDSLNPSSSTTPIFEGCSASLEPSPSESGRLSDLLKRKYPPKKSHAKRFSSTSSPLAPTLENSSDGLSSSLEQASLSKAFAAAMTAEEGTPTGTKSKSGSNPRSPSSFFHNLNPTRWRRSHSSSSTLSASSSTASRIQSLLSSSSLEAAKKLRENLTLSNLKKNTELRENREKVKQWVREQAKLFLDQHFSANSTMELNDHDQDDEVSSLDQLTNIASSLVASSNVLEARLILSSLKQMMSTSDVSSFELQHSGIISSLIVFLTQEAPPKNKKDNQLKRRSSPPSPVMARRRSKTALYEAKQPLDLANWPFEMRKPKILSSDQTRRGGATRPSTIDVNVFTSEASSSDSKRPVDYSVVAIDRDERLRLFLNVFTGLPNTHFTDNIISVADLDNIDPFRDLVAKLSLCASQLEQFAVNAHDLPNALGRGAQMLSFLARHQLKCLLKRHPDCKKAKQWQGGPVRVDPLALVQAIEKHLVTRGYGAVSSDGGNSSEKRDTFMLLAEDDSEDEIDAEDHHDDDEQRAFSSSTSSHGRSSTSTSPGNKHRLELYLDGNRLPYNMTVYQAVKHFSEDGCLSFSSSDDLDTDDDSISVSNSNIWNTIHTVHYKLVPDIASPSAAHAGGSKKKSKQFSPKTSKKDNVYLNGIVATQARPLDRYLVDSFPSTFTTPDPSQEVLSLMRIVFGLSSHWHSLYEPTSVENDRELISRSDFVNKKLSTKAHRQLQDPLMIMTGNLPPWMTELAHSCPFLLPFETRQLLFRIVSFDRNRAMLHLSEIGAIPDLNTPQSSTPSSSLSHNSTNRFMPKLQKKKCAVKRENLLSQAEKLMQEHANGQSLLEVHYEGEVGTGLGPTLEFYTLASHELQRSDLSLWRPDETSDQVENVRNPDATSLKKMVKKLSEIVEGEEMAPVAIETSFVHSPVGLFPLPIGRTTKTNAIGKAKAKFAFLGKLLAKSALDGRMTDIPLSVVCYKWLLGKKDEITWFDLNQVDPGFTLTFNKLKNVLHQRIVFEKEASNDAEEKISSITMDGCSLEDLGLDFQLPGFPNIELIKEGSKTSLSIHNIDKYLSLIAHWTLVEGVRQQLDAMKEGFQSVIPIHAIDYFFPEELDELFCGARYQPWSELELSESCLTDHGYCHDSETVKTLFRVLSQYDVAEQRAFLQFVTGSPHLPVGGFKSLHPQLTIVRKSSEEGHSADEYLPSVMTCVNYLKLPEYSSESVMRQRLHKAAREGQKSFLLS